ncbi:MAG: response regulator [Planctomycetota bacterium]|nr:MAG: response regulator [Planctomycetota bacterium]
MPGMVAAAVAAKLRAQAMPHRTDPSPPPASVASARLLADLAGPEYFTALVRRLTATGEPRWALVTRLAPGRPRTLGSLAFADRGRLLDNVEYGWEGAPCQKVIEDGSLVVACGVREAFPEDEDLRRMGAEAFAGVALRVGGETVGHLCVLHDRPFPDPPAMIADLELYRDRTAAEVERVLESERLRQALGQLRALTDHLPGLIYSLHVRPDGRREIRHLSTRHPVFTGDPDLERFLREPETFLARIHPDDRARITDGCLVEPLRCAEIDREFRVANPDGGWRWFRSVGHPVPDGEGGVTWHGILLDVDERRRAVEELAVERARLRTVIEAIPEAVFLKDPEGRWLVTNRATQEFFRLAGKDWVGRTDEELARIDPELAPVHQECIRTDREAWASRAPFVYDETVEDPDGGGPRTFAVTKVPLFDAEGRPQGLVVTARERTAEIRAEQERREMERQLALSRKMEALGLLAGGIAHDFDNLLTVILGYAELAEPRLRLLAGDTAFLAESLEQIRRAADAASALTRKLLAFGRRDASRVEPRDPAALFEEARELLDRLLGEHVRIDASIPDGLPWIRAGEGQFEQILLNLAVNGRDAMPDGGRLEISLRAEEGQPPPLRPEPLPPGSYLVLRVEDEGRGIPEEIQDRVFEPFFSTKGNEHGHGLGLATVFGTARALGGGIRLESAVGRGTLFEVWLPACEPAPAAAPKPEAPALFGRGRSVLLVEDDPGVRSLTAAVLEAAGFEVVAAASAEEALDRIAAGGRGPDLMVSDILLPGLSGPDLADRLLRVLPGTPVLFITGYSADRLARKGIPSGSYQVLEKPFGPTELLSRVQDLLAAGSSSPKVEQ